ncbi:MAG: helix-turn-helix domain-containing protein [Rickettsiales bacterium]|nr:helix-turn-helix domain-containing protein [Rickettsiales bacterium]
MTYSTHLLRHTRFIIGQNIRRLRARERMTLSSLSRRCGVPEHRLDQYELGKNAIALDDMLKIACVFGVETEGLLRDEGIK